MGENDTVDVKIFVREILILWAKFSRDSIFVDGYPHEILNPMQIFVFRKFYTCTMAKAVKQYSYQKALCVRGYYDYKNIWEAAVGETVVCMLEPGNFHDRNTVAVEKDGRIIGQLPRKVSRIHALFLKIGGIVFCTVTGRW